MNLYDFDRFLQTFDFFIHSFITEQLLSVILLSRMICFHTCSPSYCSKMEVCYWWMFSFSIFYSPTVMSLKGFSRLLQLTYWPFKFTDSLISSISELSKSSSWKNYSFSTLSHHRLTTLPWHFTFFRLLNSLFDFVGTPGTNLSTVFMVMPCLWERFAHSNELPRIIFLWKSIFWALPTTSLMSVFNYLRLSRLQIKRPRP